MADVLTALDETTPESFLRDFQQYSPATSGSLEVRFAQDRHEIAAAQALRFRVFYEEMQASPDTIAKMTRRDIDPFDDVCDHLLVVDHDLQPAEAVVGTYRLLRQDVANRRGGFYSSGEYDLAPLLGGSWRTRGFLELGRSCVHPAYRTNATIQLLWRGIVRYLDAHRIDVMFGCASFPGTCAEAHQVALSYLHTHYLAPAQFRVRAKPDRFVAMDAMPVETYSLRDAMKGLPPLIKAYLRLGAFVGDGAVIDQEFGTTDVFILLSVDRIAGRYFNRFDRRALELGAS